MIDVKFPIKVKDLAKVVDQANINPSTMNDNKLIAEFMGYELEGEFWVATMSKEDDTFLGRHLLFHTSWDWLMPVVEAINDYVNDEGEPIYSVEIIVVDRPQVNSYMEMIYLAVVEFAKRFHQYGQSL